MESSVQRFSNNNKYNANKVRNRQNLQRLGRHSQYVRAVNEHFTICYTFLHRKHNRTALIENVLNGYSNEVNCSFERTVSLLVPYTFHIYSVWFYSSFFGCVHTMDYIVRIKKRLQAFRIMNQSIPLPIHVLFTYIYRNH